MRAISRDEVPCPNGVAGRSGQIGSRRRSSTGFSSYRCSPNHPPSGMTWASGGLEPMVVNGASAGTVPGQIGTSYTNLVSNPRPEVVWGLIALGPNLSPELEEAIATQESIYGAHVPAGLVVVADQSLDQWLYGGSHQARGHQRCRHGRQLFGHTRLIGRYCDRAVGLGNLTSYRDPLQRYAFMAVPE